MNKYHAGFFTIISVMFATLYSATKTPSQITKRNYQEFIEIERELTNEFQNSEDLFGSIGELLIDEFKAENIETFLKILTSKGHMAGTPEDYEQAEYLRKLWIEQGLDRAFLKPYKVELSFPNVTNPNKIRLVDENNLVKFTSQIMEEPLEKDSVFDSSVPHAFIANSPQGNLFSKELVYVNYGRYEDFQMVESNGISVKGRFIVARYGKIFRGDKAKNAERFGASGVILYTDPKEYNPIQRNEETYPKPIWLPDAGIQRGSIVWHDGDPSTQGFPAIDDIYRIPQDMADVPKIPVHALSQSDARKLLINIGGPKAPPDWIGDLNITYRLGPHLIREGWSVQLEVNNINKIVSTYNTIGVIDGLEEPDRYVILGNHRDAWTFGSLDPSSGTAVMMELVRVLGSLLKKGWRPRRTIIIGSWAAGEYGSVGSNEWVEEHLKVLEERAVVYMNVDLAMIYPYNLLVSASPVLHNFIEEATKRVPAPTTKSGYRTLWDLWKERVRFTGEDLINYSLGSLSDHAVFQHLIGTPCSYMLWEVNPEEQSWNDFPLYHSAFEDFNVVKDHFDADFGYHTALARLWGLMTIGLSDRKILPYDVMAESIMHQKLLKVLEGKLENITSSSGINLNSLEKASLRFKKAASAFQHRLAGQTQSREFEIRKINDQMVRMERSYIYGEGIPERPYYKNVIFGTDNFNQYGSVFAPGVKDAIWTHNQCLDENCKRNELHMVQQQLAIVSSAIHWAAIALEESVTHPY